MKRKYGKDDLTLTKTEEKIFDISPTSGKIFMHISY